MITKQKLQQIQNIAMDNNQKLIKEFSALVSDCNIHKEPGALINGGNLFAGKYYPDSDKIYFSLNPGHSPEKCDTFDVEPDSKCDWYWDWQYDPDELEKNSYAKISNSFFKEPQDIHNFMVSSKFTSTFIIPWRTDNIEILQSLTKEKDVYGVERNFHDIVKEYSKQIIIRLIKYCQPKIIIVSGTTTLEYLADYLGLAFIPWAENAGLSLIGQPGCKDSYGFEMIDRKDLDLPDGNKYSYGIWKKPKGRQYLVCAQKTNDIGLEIKKTEDIQLASAWLSQLASGSMKQEFYGDFHKKGDLDKWGKFEHNGMEIFMIPHFARPNRHDPNKLSECAQWLWNKLQCIKT